MNLLLYVGYKAEGIKQVDLELVHTRVRQGLSLLGVIIWRISTPVSVVLVCYAIDSFHRKF